MDQFISILYIVRNVIVNLWRLLRKELQKGKWKINHLWVFPAVFLYDELMLRIFSGTGLFRGLFYTILFALALGLGCTALTSVFKPKVNRIITLILLYAVSLLFTVECLVKYSYQVYMTLSAIRTGAGGVAGGFASDLFRAIFFGLPKIFLFFLPALFYTFSGKRRVPARRYQLSFAALLLVAALLVQGVGVLAATHGKQSEKYKGQFNFNSATEVFGLLTSVRLDRKYAASGSGQSDFVLEAEPSPSPSATVETGAIAPPSPSPSPVVYGENVMDIDFDALNASTSDETMLSLNEYVQSLTPSKQNEYTGLFKGKNLILITAEAYSDAVLVSQELTPTLWRLTHNGFYFSDFYQPTWGGSTSSGEFSLLFGIVPMDGIESILETQTNNNYFTMGNQLSRLGYHGNAYHNGNYDFYDRQLTHINLGYDDYLGMGNSLEELTGDDRTDTTMFEKTMDTYINNQPFSVYYMTLSGHCTYLTESLFVEKYEGRVREVIGDKYKQTTVNYFCYQMELENALSVMVKKLEDAGIADDTVICMTADHYPYGLEKSHTFNNSEDYVSDLYGYTYSESWEQDRNGAIIWSGCLEHEYKDMAKEISAPSYSLDLLPTLSNLFGVEFDSRLLVGRDVLSDAEPIVLWNNYCWVTEKGKYDSYTGTFYPNDGEEASDEYINRIKQIVANKLNYSSKCVQNDYFRYLFGDD